jgi:cytochrome c553
LAGVIQISDIDLKRPWQGHYNPKIRKGESVMFRSGLRSMLAGALLASGAAQAAGVAADGLKIVMQGDGRGGAPCLACHGMDGAGNDAGGFPRLAGQDVDYLAKQIRDFNRGARVNPVMQPNVANLSEQQILDVAAYYAAQPVPVAAAPAASEEVLALGEKLATRGDWSKYVPACNSCHGPGNAGVGVTFPGIANQHPSYIRQQLKAWQNGTRQNDPALLMTAVAERLSDSEIEAVAAYLAAQPATVAEGGQ